jgi:hypothetical protein
MHIEITKMVTLIFNSYTNVVQYTQNKFKTTFYSLSSSILLYYYILNLMFKYKSHAF